MTKKESEVLDDVKKKLDNLTLVIVGNAEIGVKGLIERQAEDDKYWQETRDSLRAINETLQSQIAFNEKQNKRYQETLEKLSDSNDRLQELEEFANTLKSLAKKPKRTLAILLTVFGTIAGIINWWQDIKAFFWPH